MKCPSAYTDGYAKARLHDEAAADNYIRHTTIGDPELDPVMEELASLPSYDLHAFIEAGIEQHDRVLRDAPKALRDFFEKADDDVPPWVDFDTFRPGMRAFYRNMTNMLIAYAVGSAVEGFGTLVAKSFFITGRVTGLDDGAIRRLRQNNRHMVEIYFPGGLGREGDGWKISMRIRFVHARIRHLLKNSDEWDHEAWGLPLSAAHIGGVSLYTFSIRQFEHAISLGGRLTQEEKESIVSIWRYAGYLLGVPETILFTNEREARELREIASMCEPPPDSDCLAVANTVFKAIPIMSGLMEEAQIKSLEKYAYRLSRALIGNELADTYQYPNTLRSRTLVLGYYRFRERLFQMLRSNALFRQDAFSQVFDAAQYDRGGISYRMPDHVRASQSSPW